MPSFTFSHLSGTVGFHSGLFMDFLGHSSSFMVFLFRMLLQISQCGQMPRQHSCSGSCWDQRPHPQLPEPAGGVCGRQDRCRSLLVLHYPRLDAHPPLAPTWKHRHYTGAFSHFLPLPGGSYGQCGAGCSPQCLGPTLASGDRGPHQLLTQHIIQPRLCLLPPAAPGWVSHTGCAFPDGGRHLWGARRTASSLSGSTWWKAEEDTELAEDCDGGPAEQVSVRSGPLDTIIKKWNYLMEYLIALKHSVIYACAKICFIILLSSVPFWSVESYNGTAISKINKTVSKPLSWWDIMSSVMAVVSENLLEGLYLTLTWGDLHEGKILWLISVLQYFNNHISLLFCNLPALFFCCNWFLIFVLKGAEAAVPGVGGGQVPWVASGNGAQAGTWQPYPTNDSLFKGLRWTSNGHAPR